jgi:hypothetical protein
MTVLNCWQVFHILRIWARILSVEKEIVDFSVQTSQIYRFTHASRQEIQKADSNAMTVPSSDRTAIKGVLFLGLIFSLKFYILFRAQYLFKKDHTTSVDILA